MTDNKKIQSILKEVESMDLDNLRKAFINEKDPNKQEILNALYTYALDEQQKKVINQKEFVM